MESGRRALAREIAALAARHKIADRVDYVPGGKLAQLLDHARSAVTVNSTAGQQALWRGLPLKAFGKAVYDKPQFVSDLPLEAFFAKPPYPDGVDGSTQSASQCAITVVSETHIEKEPSTMDITTLGIDLAKSVFQLHGVDAQGVIVLQKKLRRGAVVKFLSKLEPCLIGIEACATSHYWAREIAALGHDVKMIPPAYVKPYVKRQKNDAADAEAICEAVTRPNMRFVPVKTEEQQAVLVLHRSRDLLMRLRTMILNAIRSHCAEFGIIAAQGGSKSF